MQKTAVVTGANRGLGKGLVEVLAKQGYTVFAGMRNLSSWQEDQPNITPIQLDVSNDQSIQEAFKVVANQTDHLNVLINNAGANKRSATQNNPDLVCALEKLDRTSLLNMFSVNAIGPLLVTKVFLPLLSSDPSFIINISSDRASFHDELPNSSANYGYRASKVALNMMTLCSVFDLPSHVKTCAIHPGSVLTDMNPEGNNTPQEQAEKIVHIIDHWQTDYNGAFLKSSGEFYPL